MQKFCQLCFIAIFTPFTAFASSSICARRKVAIRVGAIVGVGVGAIVGAIVAVVIESLNMKYGQSNQISRQKVWPDPIL